MSADPTYAAHLMSHARQLFEFADKCRGIGSVAYYPYVTTLVQRIQIPCVTETMSSIDIAT